MADHRLPGVYGYQAESLTLVAVQDRLQQFQSSFAIIMVQLPVDHHQIRTLDGFYRNSAVLWLLDDSTDETDLRKCPRYRTCVQALTAAKNRRTFVINRRVASGWFS